MSEAAGGLRMLPWGSESLRAPADGGPARLSTRWRIPAARRTNAEQLAATLTALKHPAIVPVFEAQWVDERDGEGPGLVVVAEAPRGATLAEVSAAHGPMDEPLVAALLLELTEALAVTHDRGLPLGSVGPERLFVTPPGIEGQAAVRLQGALVPQLAATAHGEPVDTAHTSFVAAHLHAHTVAPEVADGSAPSVAADVYALGATAAWLALGRPPFAGEIGTLRWTAARNGPDATLRKRVAERLPTIAVPVLRALGPNPWHRAGALGELRAGFEAILGPLAARARSSAAAGPWSVGSPLVPLAAYASTQPYASRLRGRIGDPVSSAAIRAARVQGSGPRTPEEALSDLDEGDRAQLQTAFAELEMRRARAAREDQSQRTTRLKWLVVLVTAMLMAGVLILGLERTEHIAGLDGPTPAVRPATPPEPVELPQPRVIFDNTTSVRP